MKNLIYTIAVLVLTTSTAFTQNFVQNTIQPNKEKDPDTSNLQRWLEVDSVFLYGGGKLLSLVTSNDEKNETTSPSGSLGLNFCTSKLSCNLFFSHNAKQKITINTLSDFGTAIMNPDLSGQSLSFSVQAEVFPKFGASGTFLVADQDWSLSESEVLDASPIIGKVGFYVRPFDFKAIDNIIDFYVDFNYTHRVISGDFGSIDRMINNTQIKRRGYNGWEIQGNVKFNAVKLYVQFSGIKISDIDVPGFSGNQVSFGIDVTGKLAKIK